jgi:hypothetical protein
VLSRPPLVQPVSGPARKSGASGVATARLATGPAAVTEHDDNNDDDDDDDDDEDDDDDNDEDENDDDNDDKGNGSGGEKDNNNAVNNVPGAKDNEDDTEDEEGPYDEILDVLGAIDDDEDPPIYGFGQSEYISRRPLRDRMYGDEDEEEDINFEEITGEEISKSWAGTDKETRVVYPNYGEYNYALHYAISSDFLLSGNLEPSDDDDHSALQAYLAGRQAEQSSPSAAAQRRKSISPNLPAQTTQCAQKRRRVEFDMEDEPDQRQQSTVCYCSCFSIVDANLHCHIGCA